MNRPNVLLMCVDHWPGPLMGAMGHDRILTPTLNRLADSAAGPVRHPDPGYGGGIFAGVGRPA